VLLLELLLLSEKFQLSLSALLHCTQCCGIDRMHTSWLPFIIMLIAYNQESRAMYHHDCDYWISSIPPPTRNDLCPPFIITYLTRHVTKHRVTRSRDQRYSFILFKVSDGRGRPAETASDMVSRACSSTLALFDQLCLLLVLRYWFRSFVTSRGRLRGGPRPPRILGLFCVCPYHRTGVWQNVTGDCCHLCHRLKWTNFR
jgi:hypothetical protein